MIVKLAVIGTLGYVGYRYLQKAQAEREGGAPRVSLAGGPLSGAARIQSNPETPPSAIPTTDTSQIGL